MFMSSTWLWLWFAVMLVVLVPWLGYGWGYRGWGPPYPRYIQRRRAAAGASTGVDHGSWGWHGDAIWGVLLIAAFWMVTATWMWR
jgi:hypothetical protein